MNRKQILVWSCLAGVVLTLALGACRRPKVDVTISPTTVIVKSGATQQFSATVNGSATVPVVWAVNGIVGGSDQFGTISTDGLYSAPVTNISREVSVSAAPKDRRTRTAICMVTVAGTSSDAAGADTSQAPH
jgi:hypothetical protein